jgi:pyruvate kinase
MNAEEVAPRAETKISYDEIFRNPDLEKRRTKIICTIGKASTDPSILVKLIDGGMDIARLDMDTLNYDLHEASMANLAKAQKLRLGKSIATMVDLVGPVVKTGKLKGEVVNIGSGQDLKIISDMTVEGDGLQIASSIPLSVRVSVGQTFYIGNGDLACEVKSVGDVSYISFLIFMLAGFHQRQVPQFL